MQKIKHFEELANTKITKETTVGDIYNKIAMMDLLEFDIKGIKSHIDYIKRKLR